MFIYIAHEISFWFLLCAFFSLVFSIFSLLSASPLPPTLVKGLAIVVCFSMKIIMRKYF